MNFRWFKNLKNKRAQKLIAIFVGIALLLSIGGYFLYRNGYIFAFYENNSVEIDFPKSQSFVTSFADKTYGIWQVQHDSGEFQGTYRDFLVANIEESNYKQFPNIDDQARALADRFMDEMKDNNPEFFTSSENGSQTARQVISQFRNEFIAETDLFIRIIEASGDSYVQPISDMIVWVKDPDIGGEMDIATFARRGIPHTPILIPAGATTLSLTNGEIKVTDWPFDNPADFYNDGIPGFSLGAIRALIGNVPVLSPEQARVEAESIADELSDKVGSVSPNDTTEYYEYISREDRARIIAAQIESELSKKKENPNVEDPETEDTLAGMRRDINAEEEREQARNPEVLFDGRGTIAVNPRTGNAEYQTQLCYDPTQTGKYCMTQGSFSFDPINNNFTANISGVFSGKRVNLFSDPITGDVYVAVSREDGEALYSSGKIAIVSAMVSQDGRIGGEFKFGNRMFRFNPNSNSFEVPIAIGGSGGFRFGQEADTSGKSKDWGTVYIDSKGNVSGKVDILGDQASVFFDRTGRIAVAANIRSGGDRIGSVSIDSDGNISGSVNVGKFVGIDGLFVSVGKGGINGVTVPIGSYLGNAIGIGINKNGGLSIGGFVPVAGLPIPIGIGQDSSGGFRLTWPGGSIGLIGGDDRPQRAPELAKDESDNIDASCIYFRHSFKKLFQTVRVYQEPCTKIEKEEQALRGKMIFDVYNDLLKRNPGLQEFMNWYFYSGHQLYKFPQHENDKAYRMSATEDNLRKFITGKGNYARAREGMENATANRDEYKWVKAGKSALDAPTRPDDIMESNPFDESTWEKVEEGDEQTGETQVAPVEEFHDALLEDLSNDPGGELATYYDQYLNSIDPEKARANVDLGNAEVETELITSAGDYPIIEKFKDGTGLVITLRKGFNEVFTPKDVGYINLIGVEADGIKVFEYDPTYSESVNKSWIVGPRVMKPGTGYYLYNGGDEGRKIVLRKTDSLGVGEKDTVIKKGWNILVNSDDKTTKLGDYTALATLSGWSGGCDVVGLCVEEVKLSDLIIGDKKEARAHNKIFFLTSDSDPVKLKKITEASITKENLEKIELKPGQLFWLYLFE